MSGVYVLELNNNKRYVGMSENIEKRLQEHTSSNGAAFTKRHGVLKRCEVITKQDGSLETWEQNETLAQMIKYGINNVRGFQWVNEEISKEQASVIKTLMCGLFSLCNICGKPGHYSSDCVNLNEKAQWMIEINNLINPKSNKDIMADLINSTESLQIQSKPQKPQTPQKQQSTPYKREIAPTGRSKCQICKEFIPKGEYRIGEESTYKGQPTTKWFHERCHPSSTQQPQIKASYEKPVKKSTNTKNERLTGKIVPQKGWPSVMTKCMKCNRNGILPFIDNCANCGKNKHPNQKIHSWFYTTTNEYESSDECETSEEDDDVCFRCGREGHYASVCYAKKHVKGYYIKD